jgi:hypothetical protein
MTVREQIQKGRRPKKVMVTFGDDEFIELVQRALVEHRSVAGYVRAASLKGFIPEEVVSCDQ